MQNHTKSPVVFVSYTLFRLVNWSSSI